MVAGKHTEMGRREGLSPAHLGGYQGERSTFLWGAGDS